MHNLWNCGMRRFVAISTQDMRINSIVRIYAVAWLHALCADQMLQNKDEKWLSNQLYGWYQRLRESVRAARICATWMKSIKCT